MGAASRRARASVLLLLALAGACHAYPALFVARIVSGRGGGVARRAAGPPRRGRRSGLRVATCRRAARRPPTPPCAAPPSRPPSRQAKDCTSHPVQAHMGGRGSGHTAPVKDE
jgi:hypothetical protein